MNIILLIVILIQLTGILVMSQTRSPTRKPTCNPSYIKLIYHLFALI